MYDADLSKILERGGFVGYPLNSLKNQVPQGAKDLLPDECYAKGIVAEKIRRVFSLSAYGEIETPLVEYMDTFEGYGSVQQEKMYKFFEAGNKITVLRPDMTAPAARVAASMLSVEKPPIRLSYIGNIYRYEDLRSPLQREVAQAGVELIGIKTPDADAEIISLAIEALLAAGLKDFQIDIGQVDFFKGLIEKTGLPNHTSEELRRLIEQKNVLALEMLLETLNIDRHTKEVLKSLPMYFADDDPIAAARKASNSARCHMALDNIEKVREILNNFELSKYISVDLGMVQSLDYYTGIIFKGFTSKLGYPICGGGRYDFLMSKYGIDLPATGFAIGLTRLMTAINYSTPFENIEKPEILFVFDPYKEKTAYITLRRFISDGIKAERYTCGGQEKDILKYAAKKGIKKVVFLKDDILTEQTVKL